jgi:hypothetical protein
MEMRKNPMRKSNFKIDDDEALEDISRIENIKCESPKFIFDSIKVHFGKSRFIKNVLIHLFLPFSIPFADSIFNQCLIIPKVAKYHFFYPLCVLVMIIVNIYDTIKFGNNYPLRLCAIFPFMFFYAHRLMIGLKYATMSTIEYKRFISNEDPTLRFVYMQQSQIITGWLERNENVLEYEIVSAALRNGIPLDTTYIHLQEDKNYKRFSIALLCWKSLLKNGNHVSIDEDVTGVVKDGTGNGYKINLFYVVKSIVNAADKCDYKINLLHKIGTVFNIMCMIVPYICFFTYISANDENKNVADSGPTVLFLVTSTIIGAFFFNVNIRFSIAALVDVQRQLKFFQILHQMIRLNDLSINSKVLNFQHDRVKEKELCDYKVKRNLVFDQIERCKTVNKNENISRSSVDINDDNDHIMKELDYIVLPKINFMDGRNVIAWAQINSIFLSFGDRWRNRLEIYIVLCTFFTVIVMAGAIAFIYQRDSQERLNQFYAAFFIQSVIVSTLFILYIALYISLAILVNVEIKQQRVTLASHVLKLREKRSILESKDLNKTINIDEKAQLDELLVASTTIEECSTVMNTKNNLNPFKVFCMAAEPGLFAGFTSLASSFYLTLATIYAQARIESFDN